MEWQQVLADPSLAEMMMKKDLYLAKGAREFWLCAEDGTLRCFDHRGEMPGSTLCAGFPARLDLP